MILETIRIALRSMTSNKLRTFLSMLGIIIGVAAVIAIVSIGTGAQGEVTRQIAGLGSNTIQINAGGLFGRGSSSVFTLDLGEQLQRSSPAVASLVPVNQESGTLIREGTDLRATLVGTGPDYQVINEYFPVLGRFFDQGGVEARSNEMVLGAEVARELFGQSDPLGSRVRFLARNRIHVFTVIGVMEEKAAGLGVNLNDQVYIPYTTYMDKIASTRYVGSFLARGANSAEARIAVGQIEYFLTRNLGSSDDFWVQSQDQILDVIDQVTGTLNIMLGGIAGISLLVGGIGIMNIMLVSVTERTREIGIRKALGAKRGHILRQFLVEALTLGALGGVVGIFFGRLGAVAIARYGGWAPVISLSSILLALGFSLLVGLFFGIYPAYKASRLDPVQALSYE